MKYIKKFNKEEIEIYNICCSESVDYDRIDYLLKNGADANAIEIFKYDNQEKLNEELLLVQCWLDGAFNRRIDEHGEKITGDPDFCIKLLKIFIKNGLDLERYVNQIFGAIQFTYDDKNFIDMTKIILSNIKNPNVIDLEKALSGIATEESYNNCCNVNHRYANVLATIYEMIEKYTKGKDPNKYFICDKIIGQKINNISIFCKDLKIDFSNKLIADECDIFLECEKDRLSILNKYIFVDNNDIDSKFERIDEDNRFEKKINKYLKNEIIEDIQFYNEEIFSKPHVKNNLTRIEIKISNNKKISIKCDESLCFMKVIMS